MKKLVTVLACIAAAKMPHVYPILPCPEGKAARKEIAGILRAI